MLTAFVWMSFAYSSFLGNGVYSGMGWYVSVNQLGQSAIAFLCPSVPRIKQYLMTPSISLVFSEHWLKYLRELTSRVKLPR